MINRSPRFEQIPINVVGSSVFGRYPKINNERTYNMYISDNFLIPYPGYQTAVKASMLGEVGRGVHTSPNLGKLVAVVDNNVYLINIFFDQNTDMSYDTSVTKIGTLQTNRGVVYITENNKPQIAISDGQAIYIYDTAKTPSFFTATEDGISKPLSFKPGFIDFHDTYFLCAASEDTFEGGANNTWRLSAQNDGSTWPDNAANIGLIQTKPDTTQAVVRVPSRGNMIYVMGETVTEPWFDVGYQLFPYQRNTSYNIDYGCLNPATIAATDEIVVWLAQNEKSGPIIVYSNGGMPEKITTDGIDYLFSQLSNPSDSQGFIIRQDGHLIYHINFYTDNLSLFYDFNTKRVFHACDENLNYFIANEVAFFNNQYYFLTKNNGNLYAFDTIYTTYAGAEIPRFRICKNVRKPSQEYFIANDIGFTIEQGDTNYQQQNLGPINLITEDGNFIITEGSTVFFITEDGNYILTEDGQNLIGEQLDPTAFSYLIDEHDFILNSIPRVDLSISIDGGETFGSDFPYVLNPIGQRKNRLMWWQLGLANDFVPQFRFWNFGRVAATDGILNIRV